MRWYDDKKDLNWQSLGAEGFNFRISGCVFVCYVKDEEKRFYNHANDKTIVSQLWRVLSVYSSGHTSNGQTYPLRQVMGMFMEFEVVP